MKWKKTSNKLINEGVNGNHRVLLFSDGTKIKETLDPNADHFTYVYPESFDLKITDACDGGCQFCHENSTVNGKHADLDKLMPMFNSCMPGTEIAIGGGNALSHPDIVHFVHQLNSKFLVPCMTINQKHLKPYWSVIEKLALYGIGVSLTDPDNIEDFKLINKLGPNVVIHTIAGILKPSDYKALKNRKVLILGYKDIRRGHDNLEKHSDEIRANIEQLKKDLPKLVDMCKAVSFDCLALEQLNPKEVLGMTDEEFARIYQGHDYEMFDKEGKLTVGTMFIDAVQMKIARSSTAPMDKRYSFTGSEDIRELLAKSCEGY
jgi:hypothetical protein